MIFKGRQLKRKKFLLVCLGLIIIIILLGFLADKILSENRLRRFDVELENLNCATSDEIKSFLLAKNFNYFYFKSAEVENNLKQRFFCISKIEQQIYYPDRLKLKIFGREGKFVVTDIESPLNLNPQIVLNLDQLDATQSTTEAYPPK